MIVADEDALMCDLAETYRIFDYRSLPVGLVATLSVGLRADSRIKMKMNGLKVPLETVLMANIADGIALLIWGRTEDGRNGVNRPQSIANRLLGLNEKEEKEIVSFTSVEEFETYRNMLIERRKNNG